MIKNNKKILNITELNSEGMLGALRENVNIGSNPMSFHLTNLITELNSEVIIIKRGEYSCESI